MIHTERLWWNQSHKKDFNSQWKEEEISFLANDTYRTYILMKVQNILVSCKYSLEVRTSRADRFLYFISVRHTYLYIESTGTYRINGHTQKYWLWMGFNHQITVPVIKDRMYVCPSTEKLWTSCESISHLPLFFKWSSTVE